MSNPVSPEELTDARGENKAVRAFLEKYQSNSPFGSIINMRSHLSESGFDGFWPEWAAPPVAGPLTIGGAQNWLRYLFSLEGAPAASGATPEWQPIETAPKDGTQIMVFCDANTIAICGGYWYEKGKCWICGGYMRKNFPPTHWMPLPSAPLPPDPNAGNDKEDKNA